MTTFHSPPTVGGDLELVFFEHRPEMVRHALTSGISSFLIDCENHGKKDRQAGFDTEINAGTPADLVGITQWPGTKAYLRIDRFSHDTQDELNQAIDLGAEVLLLPFVTSPHEVEQFLRLIAGRCRAGILVETVAACDCVEELAAFPLDVVYVGLNDLMISRRSNSLFEPILDGTLAMIRSVFPKTRFGFGGATDVECGSPIPCRMLLQEMHRLSCQFTFLRRSFKRDVSPLDMPYAVSRIQALWQMLHQRSHAEVESDHESLKSLIA